MTSPRMRLALEGSFDVTEGVSVEASGPHRFLQINGRTGYQPTSLATKLKISTDLHHGTQGSIVLWSRLRFRNLKVWNRPLFIIVSDNRRNG